MRIADGKSRLFFCHYYLRKWSMNHQDYVFSLLFEEMNLFNDMGYIKEPFEVVKEGKEAVVFRCASQHEKFGEHLAVKAYTPNTMRSFRLDARNLSGRNRLDKRSGKAVQKKTITGKSIREQIWVEQEFLVLETLYSAGADVPKVLKINRRSILMEFIGKDGSPAQRLSEVALEEHEARVLLESVLNNIRLMLSCNLVHGDLSPYNILYSSGEIYIIDFPQRVDPRRHPQGLEFLLRDVQNVCKYFSRFAEKRSADFLMMPVLRIQNG